MANSLFASECGEVMDGARTTAISASIVGRLCRYATYDGCDIAMLLREVSVQSSLFSLTYFILPIVFENYGRRNPTQLLQRIHFTLREKNSQNLGLQYLVSRHLPRMDAISSNAVNSRLRFLLNKNERLLQIIMF